MPQKFEKVTANPSILVLHTDILASATRRFAMYQVIITDREAGQRFDKYLQRILPNAGSGFLHKMLRKKNITLNDRKADGSEKTVVGDCVKIFFAQETLDKFMGKTSGRLVENESSISQETDVAAGFVDKSGQRADHAVENKADRSKKVERIADAAFGAAYRQAYRILPDIQVIFENDHIIIADKPAGILSQKAEKTDISLNDWLIGYLLEKGDLSESDISFYKPSVCNRLDRNTSGMVLCAKTLQGAQLLSTILKDRTLHKYYQLYVKGHITEEQMIEGYLVKDEKKNKVTIQPADSRMSGGSPKQSATEKQSVPSDGRRMLERKSSDRNGSLIRTKYRPLRVEQDKTLLEVELITGKPHQIRAHLASIGHPLLGDYKYGDRAWNEKYRRKFGVKSQLLHAYKVIFPMLDQPFADLGGRTFICEVPKIFERVSGQNICSCQFPAADV